MASYRSWKVEHSILRKRRRWFPIQEKNQTKGMLIATAQFDDRDKKLLTNIGIDEIWDLPQLIEKASVDETLAAELEHCS